MRRAVAVYVLLTVAAARGSSNGTCFLEWTPYERDRTMGLNHQMASLSCALGEAYYLERTLLLPSSICLFSLHTERWPGPAGKGERCVPIGELFDIELLSRLVSVRLKPYQHLRQQRQRAPSGELPMHERLPKKQVALVSGWKSLRVRQTHPCGKTTLVRRRMPNFWFQGCTSRTTDAGIGSSESCSDDSRLVYCSGKRSTRVEMTWPVLT